MSVDAAESAKVRGAGWSLIGCADFRVPPNRVRLRVSRRWWGNAWFFMREGDIIVVAFCVAVEKEEGGTRQGEGAWEWVWWMCLCCVLMCKGWLNQRVQLRQKKVLIVRVLTHMILLCHWHVGHPPFLPGKISGVEIWLQTSNLIYLCLLCGASPRQSFPQLDFPPCVCMYVCVRPPLRLSAPFSFAWGWFEPILHTQ